jgi:hypothetical protein
LIFVDVFVQLANATEKPPAKSELLAIQIQSLYLLAPKHRMLCFYPSNSEVATRRPGCIRATPITNCPLATES